MPKVLELLPISTPDASNDQGLPLKIDHDQGKNLVTNQKQEKEYTQNGLRLKDFMGVLLQDLPSSQQFEPDEKEYSGVCASLIIKELRAFYEPMKLNPPKKTAILGWFYNRHCPDWAIAHLYLCIEKRNSTKKRVFQR